MTRTERLALFRVHPDLHGGSPESHEAFLAWAAARPSVGQRQPDAAVLDALQQGPLRMRDIQTRLGLDNKKVYRALGRLSQDKAAYVVRSSGRNYCLWAAGPKPKALTSSLDAPGSIQAVT